MPPPLTVHIRVQLLAQSNTSSTWAFQFLAAFFIPAAACNAAFHALTCYLSHFAQIQLLTHIHQIIASLILTLLAFLQLNYQATNDQSKSPFATHPTAMRVAVASSVVYCLACLAVAVLRFPPRRFAFLAHHLLVSAGNIAVASLASVLLPDGAAPVVYAIFGLLAAAELLLWLYRKPIAELWIRRWRFRRFWNNIYRNLGDSSEQLMRMRLQV